MIHPDSALHNLDQGDKVHVHVSLYASQVAILDEATVRHSCSRAQLIQALLSDYSRGLMPGIDEIMEDREEPKK